MVVYGIDKHLFRWFWGARGGILEMLARVPTSNDSRVYHDGYLSEIHRMPLYSVEITLHGDMKCDLILIQLDIDILAQRVFVCLFFYVEAVSLPSVTDMSPFWDRVD